MGEKNVNRDAIGAEIAEGTPLIDPLTGMFTPASLHTRAIELTHQSIRSGEPVAMIVGDLDHLAAVNDSHGRDLGDAVLRDVAATMCGRLRAFDLCYRIDGDEFLVLLPGADLGLAEEAAERLREGVAACPAAAGAVGGRLPVTMSFGISASPDGVPFDYDAVYAEAQGALSEAKRSGRDAVRGGSPRLRLVS